MANRRTLKREAERVVSMRAMYPAQCDEFQDELGNFLPQAVKNIIKIANGYSYNTVSKKGEPITVQVPPDLRANEYLVNRALGVPRQERDATLDRLNNSRANFIEKQTSIGMLEAQVRETISRACLSEMQSALFPKQFVSEEEQQTQIQNLATAIFAKVQSMTPEEFESILVANPDPTKALEAWKGKIGVDVADVVQEVMGKEGDEEQEDDEEEG